MKQKAILSIAAIITVTGVSMSLFSFFNKRQVSETPVNLVTTPITSSVDDSDVPSADKTETLIEVVAPATDTQVTESTVTTPEDVIDYNETTLAKDKYINLMLTNFIRRPKVYIYINTVLQPKYPERFNQYNIDASITYLVEYFKGVYEYGVNDPDDYDKFINITSNFTW